MAEFVGNPDIEHVQQPLGSEKCFAAILAAVSGTDLNEAHEALVAASISEGSGSTSPMVQEMTVTIGGSVVTIEPFQSPFRGAEDAEGAVALIDEQLVASRSVALLYKRNDEPADGGHHWTLLTGNYQDDGGAKIATRVGDPLRDKQVSFTPRRITNMVERSMDFMGVFAYSLTVASVQAEAQTSSATSTS